MSQDTQRHVDDEIFNDGDYVMLRPKRIKESIFSQNTQSYLHEQGCCAYKYNQSIFTFNETMRNRISLETLPQELFFHVTSFLGPTRDLLSLTMTSRQIHYWLEVVGNSVAVSTIRARNFRSFLKTTDEYSSAPIESNLCLVVRHAKYVDTVRLAISKLRLLIAQKFEAPENEAWVMAPVVPGHGNKRKLHSSNTAHEYQRPLKKNGSHIHPHILTPCRTNSSPSPMESIDITLYLLSSCLGLSSPTFVRDNDSPVHPPSWNEPSISSVSSSLDPFLQRSCPRSIERLFLLLCGKLCAKAYKYVKARIALERLQHVSNTSQTCVHARSNDCPIHMNLALDEQRLVHFRRILHHVFVRVLEIPRVDASSCTVHNALT